MPGTALCTTFTVLVISLMNSLKQLGLRMLSGDPDFMDSNYIGEIFDKLPLPGILSTR